MKICLKCMLLGISGVIWSDLRTLWSYFSNFRILVCRITVCYKTFCQIRERLNASAVFKQLQNVLSPKRILHISSPIPIVPYM